MSWLHSVSPIPLIPRHDDHSATPATDTIPDIDQDVDQDIDPDPNATLVPDHDPDDLPDPNASLALAASLNKRVLPSRSRRGGPGVGHCEIDQAILDSIRRAKETKPLVPPSATLKLITDARLLEAFKVECAEQPVSEPPPLYKSYFDRPEVIESFRTQKHIETPLFRPRPEAVGSKLRHRSGVSEPLLDTSDEAYLARHRKFETFEKRQRRREKEKLEHEHHKLKTRIEQLRALDVAAFGGNDLVECETKRDEMLTYADDLEKRYRVLLPEPRRPDKRKNVDLLADETMAEYMAPESRKLILKLPPSSTPEVSLKDPALPTYEPTPSPRTSKVKRTKTYKGKGKRKAALKRAAAAALHLEVQGGDINLEGPELQDSRFGALPNTAEGWVDSTSPIYDPESPGAISGPDHDGYDTQSLSEGPSSWKPSKRQKRGVSLGPRGEEIIRDGALLRAAKLAEGSSRKTKRGDPFGIKLPEIFSNITLFEKWSPAPNFQLELQQSRIKEDETESMQLSSPPPDVAIGDEPQPEAQPETGEEPEVGQ